MKPVDCILIGTSAGGISALKKIFDVINGHCDLPIVVVQHLPADASITPSLVFGSHSQLNMLEALDKTPLHPSCVYFAPAGYHLLVEKNLTLALTQDEPVHYSRPSIDVLFESAAASLGERVCAILLTGANADGAAGLKAIQNAGGLTYVQDPSEADAPAMPMAALALIKPDVVGDLETIAESIIELSTARGTYEKN